MKPEQNGVEASGRVVSLVPGGTEIVAALGCQDRLVGRSHECDHPPEVTALPACTWSRLDSTQSSGQIDTQIRRLAEQNAGAAQALSIYEVDAELLDRLAPDLIVTQSQCEVCAVSLADVERAVCGMLGSQPRIVTCEPERLADVWSDVGRVAEALGCPEAGRALVERLEGRMRQIAERVAGQVQRRPRVACLEWLEPVMGAGNWVPGLVASAGGENLLGEADAHSAWLEWEAVVEAEPEVLVLMPCGFDLGRARQEAEALKGRPGWANLPAVRSGRVYVVDGHQYFNRPGPRLVDSLRILAELLHPELFEPGYEGRGWSRLG